VRFVRGVILFSAGILFLGASRSPAKEPAMSVYVVDEFARVRPRDLPGSRRVAVLRAARNEYTPFQIIVRAGAGGLRHVNAAARPLMPKRGHVIPTAWVTLYREHYIQVQRPSPKSKAPPGWYPDALIPFLDPSTGKPPVHARFAAAPFDIEPNSNQPLWVDVLTPPNAAPGQYTGTIIISAQGMRPHKIPIDLTIWDFTLPETPSIRTHFGDADVNPLVSRPPQITAWRALDEAGQRALETAYAELMAAHRICPPIPPFLMPRLNADGSIDPRATDGELQRWIERFHITGFPIRFLGMDGRGWQGDPLGADRKRNAQYLSSMYAYLRAHKWDKMAYIYVLDEPNSREAYSDVRARSRFVHEVAPGLKVLCTTAPQVQNPWGSLAGSVDIWAPLWPMFDEAAAKIRLAAGEEIWSYTALCQGRPHEDTPFWELDFPLLNYRIPTWISWHFGVTGLLYWSTTNWASTRDVWTYPLTYRDQYNMEGSLLYPGVEAGVQGLVASIRLKEIREGLEDYEYLKILEERRGRAVAEDVVKRIARGWNNWDTDARHLLEARADVARSILAK
jgi:hypothetical protein